jgi:hypothetical protein
LSAWCDQHFEYSTLILIQSFEAFARLSSWKHRDIERLAQGHMEATEAKPILLSLLYLAPEKQK